MDLKGKFTEKEKELLYHLHFFLFEENNHDEIEYQNFLNKIGITDICLKKNTINLTLKRPGIFIGQHANRITRFYEYLKENKKFQNIRIRLIENNIDLYLVHFTDQLF